MIKNNKLFIKGIRFHILFLTIDRFNTKSV